MIGHSLNDLFNASSLLQGQYSAHAEGPAGFGGVHLEAIAWV